MSKLNVPAEAGVRSEPMKEWKAVTYAKGRGRVPERHFIVGPEGEREGYYPSRAAAEQEAAARNAGVEGKTP